MAKRKEKAVKIKKAQEVREVAPTIFKGLAFATLAILLVGME